MARVIVTRPSQQAQHWAQALGEWGHEALAMPLIEIHLADAPQDSWALQEAWKSLGSMHAIMFVSSPAVTGLFRTNQPLSLVETAQGAIDFVANEGRQIRFWSTGPGTNASLQAQGVRADQIDSPAADAPQFDSEALWARVQAQVQPGWRVLIVRGRDAGPSSDGRNQGRDWLAQQLLRLGAHVQTLIVYERRAPVWSAQRLQQCQAWLQDGSIWLLSSSAALRNLPADLDVSQARCICTHERIAQAARERGFAVVCTSRPSLQDVAASIKSLHE